MGWVGSGKKNSVGLVGCKNFGLGWVSKTIHVQLRFVRGPGDRSPTVRSRGRTPVADVGELIIVR